MTEEIKKEEKKEEVKAEKKKQEKAEGAKPEEGKTEEKKKEKRPTALKRILQSRRQNDVNRQHKSQIKTAIKDFTTSLENKENKEVSTKKLNALFCLLDKAVKNNIFKLNKSSRLKSKYSLMINK